MLQITGDCNQCGLCCARPDGSIRCENLVVEGALGEPGATRCGAWDRRWHKMPIRMFYTDGALAYESLCVVFDHYLAEGGVFNLPRECSLELVQIDEIQPKAREAVLRS